MFGDVVRAHRRRSGITQEELAGRAGVSVRAIRDVETGRIKRPRPTTVRLLADALDLQPGARDRFFLSAFVPSVQQPLGSVESAGSAVSDVVPPGVLDALCALVERSMVVVGPGSDVRYRTLEGLRLYAERRLAELAGVEPPPAS